MIEATTQGLGEGETSTERERERERENAARENHFILFGKYVDLHVGTNYAGYRVRSRSNISKEEEDTHY